MDGKCSNKRGECQSSDLCGRSADHVFVWLDGLAGGDLCDGNGTGLCDGDDRGGEGARMAVFGCKRGDLAQDRLQSLAAIVIDPERCPDTAKEFGEYEYEVDRRTGEVLEGYPDLANHHIDAVRYATNRIWKRRGS